MLPGIRITNGCAVISKTLTNSIMCNNISCRTKKYVKIFYTECLFYLQLITFAEQQEPQTGELLTGFYAK